MFKKWYMQVDCCDGREEGRVMQMNSRQGAYYMTPYYNCDLTVGGDDDSDLGWMTGSWSGQRCAWNPGQKERVEGKARPVPCWAAVDAPSWPSGWGSGPGGAGSPAAGSGATVASPQLEEAGRTYMLSKQNYFHFHYSFIWVLSRFYTWIAARASTKDFFFFNLLIVL